LSQFIQIHLLTAYPPANLNRDDLGQPKTAQVGGATRLRISSQSLKRAWRTSPIFSESLAGSVGTRTKRIGRIVQDRLTGAGFTEADATTIAKSIAGVFGAVKGQDSDTEQLVHVSPEELAGLDTLIDLLSREKRAPKDDELALLRTDHAAADIALFGRMVAAKPEFNTDAAAQVAHAITVHKAVVEDDYFTAVDDLKSRHEEDADSGAGHVGEAGFGAGLFYLYLCIDRDLLVGNLQGNEELARRTLRALLEAAAKVAPSGKQASFASRAYASYCLVEKGRQQPRSLAVAFYEPVRGESQPTQAVKKLEEAVDRLDAVYGPAASARQSFNALTGTGALAALLDFAAEPLPAGEG
jgi:CRISPR system Cascade subunit CasC